MVGIFINALLSALLNPEKSFAFLHLGSAHYSPTERSFR